MTPRVGWNQFELVIVFSLIDHITFCVMVKFCLWRISWNFFLNSAFSFMSLTLFLSFSLSLLESILYVSTQSTMKSAGRSQFSGWMSLLTNSDITKEKKVGVLSSVTTNERARLSLMEISLAKIRTRISQWCHRISCHRSFVASLGHHFLNVGTRFCCKRCLNSLQF